MTEKKKAFEFSDMLSLAVFLDTITELKSSFMLQVCYEKGEFLGAVVYDIRNKD